MKEFKKGERIIIREGSIDGLVEAKAISDKPRKWKMLGEYYDTGMSSTTLYRVKLLMNLIMR